MPRHQYVASWYASTAHEAPSHPALQGREVADVCILGAGLTGLSAALELAEADAGMISDDAQWQLERDESIALLADSLEELPLVEREVLVLFYLQELTLDQLALVLEVPVGTVKSRLFRARRRLRAHLLTKGVEP